ncbi:hypothetical protein GGX14DRAFT_381423 [Mycena pura]|uniref:C3H1-type domain-containing protein n=1 Tax=Mycena pura TaxID=153505 RepID=A0AAD6UPU2_9AGAR|nr:hypothetical protein GGX14DRAFT_381423 [Mycena pura]
MSEDADSETVRILAAAETVRIRAAACQKLVDERVDENIPNHDFIRRLRETGVTSVEAQDYIEQARSRIAEKTRDEQPPKTPEGVASREGTPEGLTGQEATKFRADRDALIARDVARRADNAKKALEDVEWRLLQAKINNLLPGQLSTRSPFTPSDLEHLLGIQLSQPISSASITPALLAAAPHLAQLSAGVKADPHLEETWKLRRAFGTDKALDPVVDLMQLQVLVDPLPRTIWRSIIQDHFVDFEKLYAALGVGYDHQDEPKEFAGGYALVKKEHTSAKRGVKTEAEWTRVFAAWRTGVCFLYPHRAAELSGYLQVVTDLFHAVPHEPSIAIRFDVEARDKYAKSPYHMDDRTQHNLTLLSQMFRPSTAGSSSKRALQDNQSAGSAKRTAIPCHNWNLGFCEAPCSNRRMHGSCSECGKSHRAKDNDKCLAALQARRRKVAGGADGAPGVPGA